MTDRILKKKSFASIRVKNVFEQIQENGKSY